MSYRDDREALHHRVAQLEDELAEARREVDALRERRPRARPAPVLVVAACTLSVGLGAGAFLMLRTSPRRAPSPVVVAVPTLPATPATFEPSPAPPPTVAPAPPALPRETTARWNAKITRAEGMPLGAGSSCTIEATIATADTNATVPALTVQCGTQVLYRSTDSFSGVSQTSNDARELLGSADDKSTFTLAYSDIGTRSGRSQVDLDTTKRQGSVFSERIPRFRVDFSIPPTSVPGPPLAGTAQRLRRTGKVSHVTGSSPVKEGASCALRAMPDGSGEDCTAEVACGATILWASTSGTPVHCTYEASRPVTVSTQPQGPNLLSLDGSMLTVKAKAFDAEISLDEP